MPSIADVTPIIRAAIASLKANLPGQIALFNAEDENEVTLAEPTEFAFGAMDPLILNGPVIEVAAIDGTTAKAGIGYEEWDHRPGITVVAWHEGERGELSPTYEMSLGLKRCIVEVLTRPGAFGAAQLLDEDGSVTWRTEVLPADLTEDGREFTKWRVPVLLTFRVEANERYA